jgi:hypothetical protein
MDNSTVAIDILMEPDAVMVQRAQAANARLRAVFPEGYSLDASHRPHLTTVQQFVRSADLDKIYDEVGSVISSANPATWKLEAFKYYYLPTGDNGLAGIVVEATPAWVKMQEDILDAVAPFTIKTATNAAFYTTPDDPELVSGLVEYVTAFVPEHSGPHFMPHVTVGVAPQSFLDSMLAEPFESFAFSLAGASVYHLGNYGAARHLLKAWPF